MLEVKFSVQNSKDKSLLHQFDIHELSNDLILENTKGVYVFTRRHKVSEVECQHEIIEVNSSDDFSTISKQEIENAKSKGANCICTTWCNKEEIQLIINDVKNESKDANFK